MGKTTIKPTTETTETTEASEPKARRKVWSATTVLERLTANAIEAMVDTDDDLRASGRGLMAAIAIAAGVVPSAVTFGRNAVRIEAPPQGFADLLRSACGRIREGKVVSETAGTNVDAMLAGLRAAGVPENVVEEARKHARGTGSVVVDLDFLRGE